MAECYSLFSGLVSVVAFGLFGSLSAFVCIVTAVINALRRWIFVVVGIAFFVWHSGSAKLTLNVFQ